MICKEHNFSLRGQIKNTTVTLLLSLLEGVDSDFIPSRILEALEVDAIVEEINYQQVSLCPQKKFPLSLFSAL
jgi:hypothetical protein